VVAYSFPLLEVSLRADFTASSLPVAGTFFYFPFICRIYLFILYVFLSTITFVYCQSFAYLVTKLTFIMQIHAAVIDLHLLIQAIISMLAQWRSQSLKMGGGFVCQIFVTAERGARSKQLTY
jgi:hypothetical protein